MFADYVGIPWTAGGQGPDDFDCMGFFRMLQGKHFGIDVPSIIAPDYDNPDVLADLFGSHEERAQWLRIDKAEHGCAVIVHRPMHIGTWLDVDGGGVLHCVRGPGVIFTTDSSWSVSGFGRKEFFRHNP
jgi:hypothetical protein